MSTSKNYDPEVDVPADTARRDYMEFVIEKVLGHAGDTKKPTTMSFQVKWLNYDDSHNTWEPWKSLRHQPKLLISNVLSFEDFPNFPSMEVLWF